MQSNFERSLKLVLKHEGGFVNHPKDPGGATNKGITQSVYDNWRRARGLAPRSVRQIVMDEVRAIYKAEYWDRSACDSLPAGVDYCVFDFSVNSGVSRSVRMLQRVSGVGVDGIAGPQTINKANAMDPVHLITEICNRRFAWMQTLKTFAHFGRGWRRRVMGAQDGYQKTDFGVIDYAINMALEAKGVAPVKTADLPMPTPIGSKDGEEAPAKAQDADQSILKTKVGAGSAIAGASVAAPVVIEACNAILPKDANIAEIAANSSGLNPLAIIFVIAALIGIGLVIYSYKQKIDERNSA